MILHRWMNCGLDGGCIVFSWSHPQEHNVVKDKLITTRGSIKILPAPFIHKRNVKLDHKKRETADRVSPLESRVEPGKKVGDEGRERTLDNHSQAGFV